MPGLKRAKPTSENELAGTAYPRRVKRAKHFEDELPTATSTTADASVPVEQSKWMSETHQSVEPPASERSADRLDAEVDELLKEWTTIMG
jgi:hypothetical protein